MEFTPHTDADLERMLAVVGAADLDQLFAHIPRGLVLDRLLDLPVGSSEDEVRRRLASMASANHTDAVCFAGGGAYDHYVPAVVGALIGRGELLTAYTPYQPEMSQGMLQALFEYQTVICELTGLPVSNASLYDGGSAVAEAVAMACAATRRDGVVVSMAVDRPSRTVLKTYARPVSRVVNELVYDPETGQTPRFTVSGDTAAVVIQQPNALGVVEDVRAHAEAAHAAGAQLVVKLEPTSVGLLATPGSQGADLVVGEGQPLGQGMVFGGPTFGFLGCRREQVRRLPGRVVGRTVDVEGRRGYVMTLRAREQDIRRERATSNICTNQTLNAVAALVYLTWLGPQGLVELARACLARARHAAAALTAIEGVELAVAGPFVKEFALRLDVPDPCAAVAALHRAGYLVGPVVSDGPAAGAVLVATTERRTHAEVEALVDAVERVVKEAR
ncbi:MAG: aminomethyl-transferring glycine dehydrogenase subunit GcvPA [Egibacteraceae bacterium]